MATEPERIARLEAMAEQASDDRANILDRLDGQDAKLDAIDDSVKVINEKLSGYQGFFRGVVFVLTALGGLIGALAATFWHKISGH